MASQLSPEDIRERIRVLLVDDHKIVRQGVRMLIESRCDMVVVGEAGNGKEALALTKLEQPDIVLLELDLREGSSLELLPEILSTGSNPRVIVLTGVRDPEVLRRAVRLGATGLVMKEQESETLLRAIEKVYTGEAWLDHRMTASLIAEISRPCKVDLEAARIGTLTDREREIIRVICCGLKSKQVAQKLFISESTVRNHLNSILGKLSLSDCFELAIFAYRRGLATPSAIQSN
jgi:DNA-binding NarL/FixJ family response regulator